MEENKTDSSVKSASFMYLLIALVVIGILSFCSALIWFVVAHFLVLLGHSNSGSSVRFYMGFGGLVLTWLAQGELIDRYIYVETGTVTSKSYHAGHHRIQVYGRRVDGRIGHFPHKVTKEYSDSVIIGQTVTIKKKTITKKKK